GRPRPDCRAADSWRRAADRRGSDPSGPVPDGLPVDPGHRRIVPAAGHHGFLVGTAVLVTGSRLAAAAGAVFALRPLGGYLLWVWADLFGFTKSALRPGSPPTWSRWPRSRRWPSWRLARGHPPGDPARERPAARRPPGWTRADLRRDRPPG